MNAEKTDRVPLRHGWRRAERSARAFFDFDVIFDRETPPAARAINRFTAGENCSRFYRLVWYPLLFLMRTTPTRAP